MQRPKLNQEFVSAKAANILRAHKIWSENQITDICRMYVLGMDGYDLAKALESECDWTPTASSVSNLQEFISDVDEAHRQACFAWAKEQNVQPPFAVGTKTNLGEIMGISKFFAASYEIRHDDETVPGVLHIYTFEAVILAEPICA